MVIVAIIRGQAIHQGLSDLGVVQVDLVPKRLHAQVGAIAIIEHCRVAIEHFKKALVLQGQHVGRTDGEMEIGVVDVGKHGLPADAALRHHRVDVALQYLAYTVAALDGHKTFDVGGVEVQGFARVAGR